MTAFAIRFRTIAFAVAFSATTAFAAELPSHQLAIVGHVAHPKTWIVDELNTSPQQEVIVASPDGRSRVYRGVLLRDLIATAKPVEAGRFDLRQSIVVARATDGYVALFTWAELFNSPIGDGVLVATALDGSPIGEGEGRLALVSARDTKSGPRHVRWLQSVELRKITPSAD